MPKTTEKQLPTEDQIRARAYEIYEAQGYENGREVEHWLIAERELRDAVDSESQGAQTSTQNQQNRQTPPTQAKPTPVAPVASPNRSAAAGQKRS